MLQMLQVSALIAKVNISELYLNHKQKKDLFKVLAYNLCRLGEVSYYMKIDIVSSFLSHNNDDFVPMATCVLPQKSGG